MRKTSSILYMDSLASKAGDSTSTRYTDHLRLRISVYRDAARPSLTTHNHLAKTEPDLMATWVWVSKHTGRGSEQASTPCDMRVALMSPLPFRLASRLQTSRKLKVTIMWYVAAGRNETRVLNDACFGDRIVERCQSLVSSKWVNSRKWYRLTLD